MFVSQRTSFLSLLDRTETLSISRTVQVTDSSNDEVHSVAICAGSGGSMLLGVDADVYLTGEMSHVRLNTRRSWGSRIKLIFNAPA
jgi:putative NIF3 family GTP cyclohydrolase 1 type 2